MKFKKEDFKMLKEAAPFFLDMAKIVFAIGFFTPLVEDNRILARALGLFFGFFIFGLLTLRKARNE